MNHFHIDILDVYDHRGRATEENFKYGTGSVQNLATNVYNYRSDLIQVKQGKFNSTTFLQTIDYAYKSNGLLSSINQYLGISTTGDLFYEELFYDNYLSGSTAVSRKNGEISNIKWQRRNATIVGGMQAYSYNEFGELLTNNYYNLTGATTFTGTAKFDESFAFSGKFGKITSHIKFDNVGSILDNLTYNYVTNSPRVANINDSSGNTLGHNQNSQATSGNIYSYDANGNQKNDPYRGVVNIDYNFLDLPTLIDMGGGKKVIMTYDAAGNLLTKMVYNTGTTLVENRTYINGFEFVAYGTGTQALEMVHHSQGYYRISTTKHEYTIADHLGNTRIVYTDTNGNGTIEQSEILDENHYYAYGMEMSDPAYLNNSIYKYKFNGIERTESLGLTIDLALYRGLDPVLGKWYQVDPKAEAMGSMSPYCAMGNNPISLSDPEGDLAFIPILIGAGIGVLTNGISNSMMNQDFFKGWWKGAITGAIGGTLGQFGGGSFLENIAWGITEGGITGGVGSVLNGGSFMDGAMNGAKWGAIFAAGTSGIEAARNAVDGYGFRLDNGVIKNYAKNGQFQKAIDFVQARHGLTGASMTYNSTLADYGVTDPLTGAIEIGPSAFKSPDLLKATAIHEYGHAMLDRLTSGGKFTGWAYPPGKFSAANPTLVADGPLGYAQEIYNAGRMKIGLKALNTDNPLWNEWSRSLGQGSKWSYVFPMRFQTKAVLKWY